MIGLGLCALAEFGRLLIYNILVDGQDSSEDMDDSDDGGDTASSPQEFRGYKQMLLVLSSQAVETGKSFLADLFLRIYHGKKRSLHSTLSFDSAKVLLSQGEPIVIDDYLNDDIGSVFLSRASKACWGKNQINLRTQATTPCSNILICTNEDIQDLKVEGRNKKEIYAKFSVLDLGEEAMSSNKVANKEEKFRTILEMAKVIRSCYPSFLGLMLRVSGSYITEEQFSEYESVTANERLGNILKNVKNLYVRLGKFCEDVEKDKPESLINDLDTSSLTKKSELSLKFQNTAQVSDYLIQNGFPISLTTHDDKEGFAFFYKALSHLPWYEQSLSVKKEGVRVYQKMKTRTLDGSKGPLSALFLSFEFLDKKMIERIKEYAGQEDESGTEDSDTEVDPKVVIVKHFESDCVQYEKQRIERFCSAEQFILALVKLSSKDIPPPSKVTFQCVICKFIAKNKAGLTNHLKRCGKK